MAHKLNWILGWRSASGNILATHSKGGDWSIAWDGYRATLYKRGKRLDRFASVDLAKAAAQQIQSGVRVPD